MATRRLRAALRVFGDVLPPDLDGLKDDLRWIADQLGPVRDLDVQIRRLQTHTASEFPTQSDDLLPYGKWLDEQRQKALAAYVEASQSQHFDALLAWLQALDQLTPDASRDVSVDDGGPPRLKKAFRQLRKRAEQLDARSSGAAFHQARIRAKRLRYTAEFFEPIYGKRAQRVVKRATDLQDLLGDHQDGVVNVQHIHAAIETAAATWPASTALALGQLVQWEVQHGAEVRKHFAATFRDVEDAWDKLKADL